MYSATELPAFLKQLPQWEILIKFTGIESLRITFTFWSQANSLKESSPIDNVTTKVKCGKLVSQTRLCIIQQFISAV